MKTFVNLLPQPFLRRQLMVQRIMQWSAVLVGVVVVGALVGGIQWKRLKNQEATLAFLANEYGPVEQMQQEIGEIQQRIEQVKQSETLVLGLADEESMLSLIGIVSDAARQCDGNVVVRNLKVERNTGMRNGKNAAYRVLTLEGVGTDNIAVARFARALTDSNAFDDVQLKSTAVKGAPQSQLPDERSYTLECVF